MADTSPPGSTLRILGIAGSLRSGSYNRALLRAAQEAAPTGLTVETFDLAEVPLYNGDVEARGDPAPVVALKEAIRQADALLIATPEYN
jgi:chromate reductase